jgi:hypothetical protein
MVRLQVPPSPRTKLGSASPMLAAKAEAPTKSDDEMNSIPMLPLPTEIPSVERPETPSTSVAKLRVPQKPLHLMSLSEAALLRTANRNNKSDSGGNSEPSKDDQGTLTRTPMHAISPAISTLSLAEAAGQQTKAGGIHSLFTPSFHVDRARRTPVERPQWSSRSTRDQGRETQRTISREIVSRKPQKFARISCSDRSRDC